MISLDSIGPILACSARERAKQAPVRLLLAVVMAWAMYAGGMASWIPVWLAAALMVQGFEFWAMAPFRRDRPSTGGLAVGLALMSTILMATLFGGMALIIWTTNHPALVTLAALTLAGGLLTNVASGIGSRLLFFIGGGPYLLFLALMPVIKLVQGDTRGVAVMTLSAALFAGMMLNIYWRVYHARQAEVRSRAEAERRLEQAQGAMADRAAMAAIVSHELRTPVSAILAGAHVIRDGKLPEKREETAELIIDAGRLMTGMLNDLLDHSKMEAGAMAIESRDFELGRACARHRPVLDRAGRRERPGAGLGGGSRRSRLAARRSLSLASDHQQSGVQRHQVHAGRCDPSGGRRAAWRWPALSDPDRRGSGRRHYAGSHEPAVFAVRAGVRRGGAHLWRGRGWA